MATPVHRIRPARELRQRIRAGPSPSRPCPRHDSEAHDWEEAFTMSSGALLKNSDAGARAEGPRNARGRVLIVDDEDVIASTLKEFLMGEAYEVATAMDMPKALGLIESF